MRKENERRTFFFPMQAARAFSLCRYYVLSISACMNVDASSMTVWFLLLNRRFQQNLFKAPILTTTLCLWAKTKNNLFVSKANSEVQFCMSSTPGILLRHSQRSTWILKCQVYSRHFYFLHKIVFHHYTRYFNILEVHNKKTLHQMLDMKFIASVVASRLTIT